MQTPDHARPVAANFACLAAMVFWAVGFPAGEILLETWGTVMLIIIRLSLGITCLTIIWIYLDGFQRVISTPWPKVILVGGIGFGVGTVLLLYGQKLSDPVTPAIAAAMMPIAGAVLEVFLDGRKLRFNLIAGIVLALAGGLMATGAQLSHGSFGIGALICLISVALFAWGTRAATKDLQDLSVIGQTTATLIGALCFNLFVFAVLWVAGVDEVKVGKLDATNLMHLINFAIIAMAISQFLWIWGAGKLGILLASFHMNAMPFYVMALVAILFAGTWNWNQAMGAGLVAAGVIVAQSFRRKPALSNERAVVSAIPTAVSTGEVNTTDQTAYTQPTNPKTSHSRPFQPFMWMGT